MSRPKVTLTEVRAAFGSAGLVPSLRVVNTTKEQTDTGTTATVAPHTPWLTVKEAAEWARCGEKMIYREVKAGRLRAAKVGGRRELRLKPEWVDEWLTKTTTALELSA